MRVLLQMLDETKKDSAYNNVVVTFRLENYRFHRHPVFPMDVVTYSECCQEDFLMRALKNGIVSKWYRACVRCRERIVPYFGIITDNNS